MAKAKTKGRKRINLEFQAKPGSSVNVAGTFNGWNPGAKPMKQVDGDGRYKTTLMLPKGRHEYKFLIDGNWCTDPANPECVQNDQGSFNNVLVVQ